MQQSLRSGYLLHSGDPNPLWRRGRRPPSGRIKRAYGIGSTATAWFPVTIFLFRLWPFSWPHRPHAYA